MSGPAIFIGIGIAIALASLFSSRFAHDPTEAERRQKRSKYLTWWLTRRDRLPDEYH